MIKAILLDIDGVIVGEKVGYNSPFPHPSVIEKIRTIHKNGIKIILCTGKPYYSITKIIADASLDNPHITDGGALTINPVTNTIVQKHVINKIIAFNLIKTFLDADMYVELYTPTEYIIQKSQYRDNLTPIHAQILQRPPKFVASLLEETQRQETIKILPIAINENDKARLIELYDPFEQETTLSFGIHPIANPHQFGLITAKNVSKKQAAIVTMNALNISLDECLGIGDSTSDWQFMDLCTYAAAPANATEQLKTLVLSKGVPKGYIGPSVDENGILDIFNHFLL
jgi:HAD superfamily hydrolase (TIGR01484 family)